MAERQVIAEFDFEAQSGTSEIPLAAGEILAVLRDNIEGGWMEGRNSRGKIGLFPASYVIPYQASSSGPPPCPPPPMPATVTAIYPSITTSSRPPVDDWNSTFGPPGGGAGGGSSSGSATGAAAASGGLSHLLPKPTAHHDDDFDDDWTDEEEEEHGYEASTPATGDSSGGGGNFGASGGRQGGAGGGGAGGGFSHHQQPHASRARSQSVGAGAASKIKGNMNRFSNFVKSGMEAYILSETKIASQPGERHEIVYCDGRIVWKGDSKAYTCTIDKPTKATKLKGLKSFIAYSLTSTLSGIMVSRRYKHFDWLYEVMSNKYIMLPLPPLPEKQVTGRYEEDLIDYRKHILQLWCDRICRHPVLNKSDVWLHFLTCTDEKQWKNGKRRAEKDEYIGGAFMHCITVPEQPLNVNETERQIEHFRRGTAQMEDGARVLSERLSTYQRLLSGPVKQNWQKMAAAFTTISHSFKEDHGPESSQMADAFQQAAHEYHQMGEGFEQHGKVDVEPVLERIYAYRGTVQRVPDIVNLHKQALGKWRGSEKAVMDGRAGESEATRVKQRVDAASYVLMAEISHLTSEKAAEFRQMMATYLRQQQQFYQNMAATMGNLAKSFE